MDIHTYASQGDLDRVKGELAKGVPIDSRDEKDYTPLAYAAKSPSSDEKIIQMLIDSGADVNAAVDRSHYGPLGLAARSGNFGKTALMLAAEAGKTACLQRLLQAGADPSLKNEYEENAMSLAANEEIMRCLEIAGQDIGDISTELKRKLTGQEGGETLNISKAEYRAGKHRRFGKSNPEVMDIPFWREMVRAGIPAYHARMQFEDTDSMDDPVWCFSRFGTSFTELPDGRFVQIGGEHEDFYDPDFCIYNDVIVHERSGKFTIRGYPQDVFPPTDFHSATHVAGFIYMIGGLGYHGSRQFGTTPIYRLNCTTWQIEAVASFGDNPGWIYEHKARLAEPGVLVISGGKVCQEFDGEEQHVENEDKFCFDLTRMIWTRTSNDSPSFT